MNQPETTPKPSSGSGGKIGLLMFLAVLVGGGVIAWMSGKGGGNGAGPGGGEVGESPMLLKTRVALAATENLATDEANDTWNELFLLAPNDDSVALNRALNRVLRVDQLAEQAKDGSATEQKRKEARMLLPDAIEAARSGVGDYAKMSDDPVIPLWLNSRVDLHYASLLPRAMTKPRQVEVYNKLVEAVGGDVGKSATSIMLAGPLTDVLLQLEDPNDGLPKNLLGSAVKTLTTLSDQNPDNLFLAIHAARLNIASENAAAKRLVLRTQELAQSIEPSLSRKTAPIGVTADELVKNITDAIDAGQWNDAVTNMQYWFNVLNPTELVKTDRRRASPHPLDRLSFESLRRLSAAAEKATPINKGSKNISFDAVPIAAATDVALIAAADFDIDLDDDLLGVSGKQLTLWRNDGEHGWGKESETELAVTPKGMLVVDLFRVGETHPELIKQESNIELDADGQPVSLDGIYRHEVFPSVVAFGDDGVQIIGIDGRPSTAAEKRFRPETGETGLEDVKGVLAASAGDLEGDGDLDLVFATKENGLRLFVNRDSRTFFEVTHHDGGFDSDDPATAIALVDIDRDLDLDVITLHAKSGQVGQLENLLHLQFRGRMIKDIDPIAGAHSIAIADVDSNVSWDLVIAGQSEVAIVYSQTADAGVWTVERTERSEQTSMGLLSADFDNDSWNELVVTGQPTRANRVGPWNFDTWQTIEAAAVSSAVLADINGDGKVDLLSVQGGNAVAMTNTTDTDGNHMIVRFKGIADNAANSGRVNHYAIGSVLELRFGPHYRARVIDSPATHFGLGDFDQATSIRVILPNGLTQTIRDPNVNALVEEEQRLKGSCPYLYAWDGEKFVFMTDCLWAAPLGLQVASGVVAKDRPWEYLKVDGQHVKPRDGKYEFRITEELWEIAYIDKLEMIAVDRPADVEVWTNEKVGPGSIAEPTIFAFRPDDLRQVASASDTHGRDVTKTLASQDKDFVQGFDRRIRQGLCKPHWIDVDFGDSPVDPKENKVYLVLTGWILPTDTSLNIQIDQNPELPPIEFPSVWVPDANAEDGWRKAIPYMGFPGGKTKTIVVDVTDVVVADDPRFRIRTSAQIYWDSAKLAVQNEPPAINTHALELLSADVDYHGYSRRIEGERRQPESYDYAQPGLDPIWPPLRGPLTDFGPCLPQLSEWDDSMIVFGAGDEVRFSVSLPETPVPEGWKRDFILHCVGWDKDADLNTLTGQTTGPMPFRAMDEYPPTAAQSELSTAAEQQNAIHRRRHQAFRAFWRRDQESSMDRFHDAAKRGLVQ